MPRPGSRTRSPPRRARCCRAGRRGRPRDRFDQQRTDAAGTRRPYARSCWSRAPDGRPGPDGATWQSAQQPHDAASLTFSLGLPLAPKDWSGLSLAVGVSVAESLDPSNELPIGLKWPNDLWVGDRKLGGILIETALPQTDAAERYLVIGIGLNIGPREAAGFGTPPAWLQEWRPSFAAPELLREVMLPLLGAVRQFQDQGFVPFADRFAARDVLRGREVRLSDGTAGVCEGVGWGGELLVQTGSGLKTITSAEVSVRPRPGTSEPSS